jgi:hypothetical protein
VLRQDIDLAERQISRERDDRAHQTGPREALETIRLSLLSLKKPGLSQPHLFCAGCAIGFRRCTGEHGRLSECDQLWAGVGFLGEREELADL